MNLTEKQINEIIVEETKRVLAESRLQKLKNLVSRVISRITRGEPVSAEQVSNLIVELEEQAIKQIRDGKSPNDLIKSLKGLGTPEAKTAAEEINKYQKAFKQGVRKSAGKVEDIVQKALRTNLDEIDRNKEQFLAQAKNMKKEDGTPFFKTKHIEGIANLLEQIKNAPGGASRIDIDNIARQVRAEIEVDDVEQVVKSGTLGNLTKWTLKALFVGGPTLYLYGYGDSVEVAMDAAGLTTREVLEAQFGFPYPGAPDLHMTTGELEIGTRVKRKEDIEGRQVSQVIGFEDGDRKKPIFSANTDIDDEDDMFNN